MEFLARICYNDGVRSFQTMAQHSRGCARYASQAAMEGLRQTAYLAGLLHDMGKCTAAFNDYIQRAAQGEHAQRGSVNHTFAAVRFVMERWHGKGGGLTHDLTCELLAFAMGGHHGLFDALAPDGRDGLAHRLDKEGIFYEEARENFLSNCAGLDELDTLFAKAAQEVSEVLALCHAQTTTELEMHFMLAMLMRLLLSLVIEGDRCDAAAFSMVTAQPPTEPQDAFPPWQALLHRVESELDKMPAETDINRVRRAISDTCRRAATLPKGVYRLCVPTGGGKTLSGLRYALAAASHGGQKRIIFAVPLLSVLEQNASVIRRSLGQDDLILEHHSNVVREPEENDSLHDNHLLMESWNAPVIITTLVQLLNTLLDGKTSAVRRLQALQDSIVVIDEVQTVPRHMLTLFNIAVNFLSGVCGATFVLCSATQPSLESADHPIRYAESADLVPYDANLWQVFRRTQIADLRTAQGHTAEEIMAMALENVAAHGSALVICNTKAQAREIFALACSKSLTAFHLSTSMCMAHRIATLKNINECLARKEPVLCVATQLVEAGVDFSFGCVIRVLAGLDNIIQAAGRCNRSGEFGALRPVYIVNLRGEQLSRLPEIFAAQLAAQDLLIRFQRDTAQFGGDLTSQAAVSAYYRKLYCGMPDKGQDFPVTVAADVKTSLYSLLSDNMALRRKNQKRGGYVFSQAFRTAGNAFKVFDDNSSDILVPYGPGAEIIGQLCSEAAMYNLGLRSVLLNKAKLYSVSIYGYELDRLKAMGAVYDVCQGTALALIPGYYDSETGLSMQSMGGTAEILG